MNGRCDTVRSHSAILRLILLIFILPTLHILLILLQRFFQFLTRGDIELLDGGFPLDSFLDLVLTLRAVSINARKEGAQTHTLVIITNVMYPLIACTIHEGNVANHCISFAAPWIHV